MAVSNARIAVDETNADKYLDTCQATVDAHTVQRERINIVDGASETPVAATVLSGRDTSPVAADNPIFTAGYIRGGTSIQHGRATVGTAGVPQVLAGATTILGVIIRALSANNGKIYVGTITVSSSTGYELEPGESIALGLKDASYVYLNSDYNNEGVSYILIIP